MLCVNMYYFTFYANYHAKTQFFLIIEDTLPLALLEVKVCIYIDTHTNKSKYTIFITVLKPSWKCTLTSIKETIHSIDCKFPHCLWYEIPIVVIASKLQSFTEHTVEVTIKVKPCNSRSFSDYRCKSKRQQHHTPTPAWHCNRLYAQLK